VCSSDLVEPLHPLIVARDGDDVQAQVANSEKMLGHAVIHATAANIPVLPVTRVDLNIASGIVRAIKELRISAIVIGWNVQVSTQQRIFGSVLDQLMTDTNQLLLVSKLEKPVNTNTRLIIIIPPLVEREVGFASAIRSMKFLSNQIGAPITIHTVNECVKRIMDLNKTVKPDLDVKVQSYTSWNDMMVGIRSRLNSDDLCVLFNVRESAVGWQPDLNKLPRSLAAMRPDMNLVVVYPAENKMDSGLLKPVLSGHSLHKILEPEYCSLGLEGNSISQAVHQMMARFWPDRVDVLEDLKASVLQSVRGHDPELTRGVLLLHAHSQSIDSTMLLMGIHPEGLSMSELDHRIHVLFILLSPVDRSPQQHLQNLASIARLVRSDDIVDDLIRMKDASDLSAFLEVEVQPD
jgi:mannitol/fructose-specific phosphotransferase system IIA component (Ntr-type)